MPARTATSDCWPGARPLRALSLVIAVLAWALTAHASPPPRPDINDYTDTQAFVADMLNWQRQYGAPTDGMAPPAGQGNEEDSGRYEKPWHRVTGPEDLEQAVRNADGYEQPRYPEPRRFDRTTHISFPLPPSRRSAWPARHWKGRSIRRRKMLWKAFHIRRCSGPATTMNACIDARRRPPPCRRWSGIPPCACNYASLGAAR